MMRDDDDLRRALIATAVAYVTAPHGAGAREILRGRLEQLSRRWRDYASGQDAAAVAMAAARMTGVIGKPVGLGDPEHELRTAVNRYFARAAQDAFERMTA